MVSYKRKREYAPSGAGRALGRRKITIYRAIPSRVAYGVGRTGGNYNLIARRWDSRMGSYRVGPGPERKFVDIDSAITVANLAAGAGNDSQSGGFSTPKLLNPLSQGTDSTTRIGRKILMKSIQGRFTISLINTASGTLPAGAIGGQVRLLIVYDAQANGAAPLATDIVVDATTGAVVSPMNLNNRERFKILLDKFVHLDPQGPNSATIKWHKKCSLPVIFNSGNAGTIADIQTGSIYMIAASTCQATGAFNMLADFYTRIRFLDD